MAEKSDTISLTDNLLFWASTHPGMVRDHNEDNFLVDRKLNLFVIADGMGGHAAGEIASAIAVNKLRDVISDNIELIENYRNNQGNVSRQDINRILEHSVQAACAEIYSVAQKYPEKRGMGTTLSSLLIIGTRGFIAHVGDSKIYLIRQDKVYQLTEDHSLFQEMLKRGKVTRDSLPTFPYKNAVTRAVGVYESVEVDILDFDVLPGDQFLLTSDGLTGYVIDPNKDLLPYFSENEVRKIPDQLIDYANKKGGQDNITTVVVRVEKQGGVAEKLAQEVNLKIETLKIVSLFRYLSHPEILRILNNMEFKDLDSDSVIIKEGEIGEELFIILQGDVKVMKKDMEIARLSHGSHFGEMSLIEASPRSASVKTMNHVKLLVMSRKEFFNIIKNEPKLATKLLWSFLQVLSKRLRDTSEKLQDIQSSLPDITEDLFEEKK